MKKFCSFCGNKVAQKPMREPIAPERKPERRPTIAPEREPGVEAPPKRKREPYSPMRESPRPGFQPRPSSDPKQVFCEFCGERIKESMIPAVDFRYIEGREVFGIDTEEYQILDSMEEKEWEDYLDEMAESGTSVEYSPEEDIFVAENITGM